MKTAYDVLKESGKLDKNVIAAQIDGTAVDLTTPVNDTTEVKPLTFEDQEGKNVFWHTSAHILADAVKRLYPEFKLMIGPAIENGFFYDIETDRGITTEMLQALEAEMKKIVKENLKEERFELTREEAINLMKERNESHKVDLIARIPEGETISFYKQGDFIDLCRGPHLFSTGAVKAIRLTQASALFLEGGENAQFQRIYGISFPKKAELDDYFVRLEEARKRDHNKIGRELELFTTVDYIGQGLPILLPKGARIIQLLQRFVEDEEQRRGYLLTKTPFLAKKDLYKISGHWDHYRDSMFILGDETKDKEVFALRPMTCPFQFQTYLVAERSYRDLPMRLNETSTLFRNESSGEMHGLIRVRQFTISEGHIACRPDQVEEEFRGCLDLIHYFLNTLGLENDVTYRFSKWDEKKKEKYVGSAEEWNAVQTLMKGILDRLGVKYVEAEGEAAFYGPKLDIQTRNVYGKEDTLITVQIDFLLASRFGMEYTDADGKKKNPYVIHRTSIGCYERTLALLIEKYAGAFPLWLAPEQVRVLPVSALYQDYALAVAKKLEEAGIRVAADTRNEKIGYKIRQAEMQKTPYMLIVGEKETGSNTVSVRARKEGDLGAVSVDEFLAKALQEIATRKK
ncbi:MAG: threonine--tRNA ligase [Planctomycetia bacterium]|nr:threonine--tRNA ligase [Planctomycetia bacterium]